MINLHLEWREVLWWMQGGMAGSHIRWSVYEDMVNKVWPQCTEQERRNIHYIMERDFGTYWRNSEGDWKPESEIFDKTFVRILPASAGAVRPRQSVCRHDAVQEHAKTISHSGAWRIPSRVHQALRVQLLPKGDYWTRHSDARTERMSIV